MYNVLKLDTRPMGIHCFGAIWSNFDISALTFFPAIEILYYYNAKFIVQ